MKDILDIVVSKLDISDPANPTNLNLLSNVFGSDALAELLKRGTDQRPDNFIKFMKDIYLAVKYLDNKNLLNCAPALYAIWLLK